MPVIIEDRGLDTELVAYHTSCAVRRYGENIHDEFMSFAAARRYAEEARRDFNEVVWNCSLFHTDCPVCKRRVAK